MKILIFVSGSIKHGLDSPTAGEGTWALNLAKMLSLYGHEVDCMANSRYDPPSWGNSIKPKNVYLSYAINTVKEYDLVIYTPWENLSIRDSNGKYGSCLTLPIKSKWFAHCTFGWNPSIHNDHECKSKNHVLVYPYIQDSAQFPPTGPENGFKTFALPIPIGQSFAPLDLKRREYISWTCKGAFHPDWPDGHYVPAMGIRMLRALERIHKELKAPMYFIDGQYFRRSPVAEKMGVMDIVNRIQGATLVHKWLPKQDFLQLLSRTRVTITIAGMLGSFGESIFMGAVPLCFTGHIYRNAADRFGIKLDTYDATEEEFYSCIKKLYTDDAFYEQVILAYQEELRYHKYDIVYNDYFLPMVKELGL